MCRASRKKGGDAVAQAKNNLIGITKDLSKVGVVGVQRRRGRYPAACHVSALKGKPLKLIPGMEDLLAQQKGLNATQEDAVGIGNLIGKKAMTGQTGALSKAGIIMTAYQRRSCRAETEQQRAAMMAEILKRQCRWCKLCACSDAGRQNQEHAERPWSLESRH